MSLNDEESIMEKKETNNLPLSKFKTAMENDKFAFFVLSFGTFGFYLCYGYMQEYIFTIPGMKNKGWTMTLVQFSYYVIFSKLETWFRNENRQAPLKVYIILGITTLTTMGCSNASLGYLNYPTQVIFKCCKLIPVLIGGILIQGKKYGFLDFSAAALMSIGLTLFTIADKATSPNFNPLGILLISTALVADAILGNVQEDVMKNYGASTGEIVLYSYSFGFVFLLIGLFIQGDLFKTINFFNSNANEIYGSIFIFSLSGYIGILIVLSLVKRFDAFVAVTVTSFRKVLTIVISFIMFSKPFTLSYVYSGIVVVLGIYLNLFAKNNREETLRSICQKIYCKLLQKSLQKSTSYGNIV